jgi:hypothetical protein
MMKPTITILLVASLSAPFTASGGAAQISHAQTQAPAVGGCDAPPPVAVTLPGTRPTLDLPEAWIAVPIRAPFCSPSAHHRAEDVSEWYGHRLTLHRYAAWTAVASFPVEIYTGWRLRSPGADPEWVRDTHRATVWVLGSTFAVNTVTGVWNWWDDRKTPEGRGWRTAHALVMVAADAAMFATARAGQARARGEGGEWHRELAFTTAGLTAIGHLMMLGPFRRD